ncbi:GEM-like protein 8 [Carex littledalei]|uniref:GEM-like protein 8 n=1 Tax=Carex littledalei TaxID=544730 RepID=A0A833R6V0_9POAL|nr:GEM-like protein 8 [Carex littledalei]
MEFAIFRNWTSPVRSKIEFSAAQSDLFSSPAPLLSSPSDNPKPLLLRRLSSPAPLQRDSSESPLLSSLEKSEAAAVSAIGLIVKRQNSFLSITKFISFNQNFVILGQVIGIPAGSPKTYAKEDFPSVSRSEEALEQNSSETTKRNLSLGKRILQAHSGVERLFRKSFSVDQNERLLKGHHCCLYTTDGPIRGVLFISTKRIAFCSDKPLLFTSPKGEIVKVPYKVLIPLSKVKEATPSKNVDKLEENYVRIVTIDKFEFWFSGFVKQTRSFESLQQSLF